MKNINAIIVVLLFSIIECSSQTISGQIDGHNYVDLGLPSGRLWATCDVGAKKATKHGDSFVWGETKTRENFDWNSYKSHKRKYNSDSTQGEVDSLKVLLPEDDAATVNWGNNWRMPTFEEQQELIDGCNWEWTKNYHWKGMAGFIGTSKTNKNTIFLPEGKYWSSSVRVDNCVYAYDIEVVYYKGHKEIITTCTCGKIISRIADKCNPYSYINWSNDYRDEGCYVRAVVNK